MRISGLESDRIHQILNKPDRIRLRFYSSFRTRIRIFKFHLWNLTPTQSWKAFLQRFKGCNVVEINCKCVKKALLHRTCRALQGSVEHDTVSGSRSNRILHFRTGSGLDWILKKLYRIRYGYPNCIDHCSQMLNQSFFGYKPDWIKYFDRFTGSGSDGITERKVWTGLGFQKYAICSTLLQGTSPPP